MPLTRYQIRNEYSLADPELYRAADKDDPEALLEGVAMSGLVGVLRQLGDLAEFAAEIFHDLHEEVMATAARGHGLMVRVQQLEAEFPSIEKAFLSQTNHSIFFSNAGMDWHPNLQMEQNVIASGDLPRCVMDSYEECRGPPRLFFLDKFDVAGAGACLKRYTDPSFFKIELASSRITTVEVQREKKSRKVKKKGSRWRNGETPENASGPHAKLHQLFLEERIENGYSDPARLVKLKRRLLSGSPLNSRSGKSYMEKFVQTPSPEHKTINEISVTSQPLTSISDNSSESGIEIHEISSVGAVEMSSHGMENTVSLPHKQELLQKPSIDIMARQSVKMHEPTVDVGTQKVSSESNKMVDKELKIDAKEEGSLDGDHSEDLASEVDNYMDALTTMESEGETDTEYKIKNEVGFQNTSQHGTDSDANEEHTEVPAQFSDSQSLGNSSESDDGNGSCKKGSSSFSYSDTVRSSAEIVQSDGEETAKPFPSTETHVSEIVDTLSKQLSMNKELMESSSHEPVSTSGSSATKDSTPNAEEECFNSYSTNSNQIHLPLYPGESVQSASLVESELGEILPECVNLASEKLSTESGTNQANSSELISDVYSQTRDDAVSSVPVENHSNIESDCLDSKASSGASANPDLASGEKQYGSSADDHAGGSCSEKLVSVEVGSVEAIISLTEKQSASSASAEVDVCSDVSLRDDGSDVMKFDDTVLAVSCPISAAEIKSGITSKGVEVDETVPEMKRIPEIDDASTHVELNSENITLLSHEDDTSARATEEISKVGGAISVPEVNLENSIPNRTEVNDSIAALNIGSENETSMVDASQTCSSENQQLSVTSDGVPQLELDVAEEEVSSSVRGTYHEGTSSGPEDEEIDTSQASLGNIATDSSHEVYAAVSNTGAYAGEDFNDACLFTALVQSPSGDHMNFQECFSGAGNLHQEESEFNEAVFSEYHPEPKEQKKVNQLEVGPNDSDSISLNSTFYDNSDQKTFSDVPDSSLAEPTRNSLAVGDISTALEFSKACDLELERESVHCNCTSENSEDAISSPLCCLPETETPLEQSLVSQAHQVDCLQGHNFMASNCLDHNDQERCFHASPKSCPEEFPSQASSEVLTQSSGWELERKQVVNSVCPSFMSLPEPNHVSMEEMPPLPPLPPMQWRVGRLQNVPLALHGELAENGQALFPKISPYAADDKDQSSFTASHGEIGQPGDSFIPLSVVEGEQSRVPEHNGAYSTQPPPSQMQLPTTGSEPNRQHDSLTFEGTQSPNSCLTLPAVSNERPEQGFHSLEENIVQSTPPPFLEIPAIEQTTARNNLRSLHEKSVLPLNEVVAETGPAVEASPHGSQNFGKVEDPSDSSKTLPAKVEEQLQFVKPGSGETAPVSVNPFNSQVLPSLEGEGVWPSNAFALAPTFEVEKVNANPAVKLPRPRSPLIDAVVAHDRSTLRKVSERVRRQIAPKVEERDSLLEQIRTKSFSLKPALVTRPSIQGPKTNLRVAAILEKANAIRQATAGSDEDDDTDSWSDS
ncbi:protein SCAR2 isoform X1 [Carica papaya]|uniref:protein SCAR2 isoform X1 n=1 Tax=Carica papaya TaxID=3649 RepID=UPI000B8C9C1D|nr:protein SCAR2 isoform X1 [Carica papaya]XP_021908410.1 protein SCAR2 isoform X1 [Carica papaya]